jgi:hypothetical protein
LFSNIVLRKTNGKPTAEAHDGEPGRAVLVAMGNSRNDEGVQVPSGSFFMNASFTELWPRME